MSPAVSVDPIVFCLYSKDLKAWSAGENGSITAMSNDWEQVTVDSPGNLSGAGSPSALFVRLKIGYR